MIVVFLLPAFLFCLVLFVYPAVSAFYVSLNEWSGFTPHMKFIGLGNFQELFRNTFFWRSVLPTTAKIIFVGGVLVFAFSFLLAGILHAGVRGKGFLRGVLFFPSLLSQVAIVVFWGFIYNKNWGLLNGFLRLVGLGMIQPTWTSTDHIFGSALFVQVWANVGFYCLILLAALDRIPPSLIDAAKVEGAGDLTTFFRIKIPLIWDVMVTSIVLWGISAVKAFGIFYAFVGPSASTPLPLRNIAVYLYITAFGDKGGGSFRMGYATSMGIFMFLLIAALYLLVTAIGRREKVEY
jgi:ABC-type sugar transport system permease subunit